LPAYDPEVPEHAPVVKTAQPPTQLEEAIGDVRRSALGAVSVVDDNVKHLLDGWFSLERTVAGKIALWCDLRP
jgi:DNA integrity scanning protein DisA with diadenylate cyclase activity